MIARAAVFSLVSLVLAGCGTLAGEGGGAENLPVSGAGPYTNLDSPSPLLEDDAASLDDPLLLVNGEALSLWFTRRDASGHATIGRAQFTSIDDAAPVVTTSLSADLAWEGGSVAQPALLPLADGRFLLAYATASGAIGWALGDGDSWTRAPMPALTPTAAEGAALASPALLSLDDSHARLIYAAAGSLLAADAAIDDLLSHSAAPFVRESFVIAAPGDAAWLPAIGRATARTVITPAGRRRHDLLLTGRVATSRAVGFASSFDGAVFVFASDTMLDSKAPEEWAPTIASWRGGDLLVYAATLGLRSVLQVAAEQ